MNCEEFIEALDRRAGTEFPTEAAWIEHARSCPTCSLALRLERSLREAPSWDSAPALSPERRARVLAEVKLRNLCIPSPLQLLRESAVAAFVVFCLLGATAYALSGNPGELFPELTRGWLRPILAPLEGALLGLVAAANPLLQSPVLLALLAATTFAVCLAAIFSARVISLRHPA